MLRVLFFAPLISLAPLQQLFASVPTFASSESAHIIVHYVPGTAAERDLEEIIGNRERAFSNITQALEVTPKEKLSVYLYPTRESTPNGKGAGSAFKDGSGVSVNYFDFTPSYERTRYGHELTHAIAFRLAGEHHPFPLLSEGIAEVLDQSDRNLHKELAACTRIFGERQRLRVNPRPDLNYRYFHGQCVYHKAGSFVRFLIDTYGWKRFRKLYRATIPAKRNFQQARLAAFRDEIRRVYAIPLETLEESWNEVISPHLKDELPRLPPKDANAIQELFSQQDSEAASHNFRGILAAYDPIAKRQIPDLLEGIQHYSDQLRRTKVVELYDLGIKNGRSALALVTREFANGHNVRISCRLEKMADGWKIHTENFNALQPAILKLQKGKWSNSLKSANTHPLTDEDRKAISDLLLSQDAAAASNDTAGIRDTYITDAEDRISYFAGNLNYYLTHLKRTEILKLVYEEDGNDQKAAALTLRHFDDGRDFKIRYLLLRTEDGWKISDENWLN